MRQNAAGGSDMFEIAGGKIAENPAREHRARGFAHHPPAGYTTDGSMLYWIDSRGRDTAALIAEDIATGERTVVAEHDKADIGGTMRDTKTGVVQAYGRPTTCGTNGTRSMRTSASRSTCLASELPGDFAVQSRTEDDDKWIVGNDPLTAPARSLSLRPQGRHAEPSSTSPAPSSKARRCSRCTRAKSPAATG